MRTAFSGLRESRRRLWVTALAATLSACVVAPPPRTAPGLPVLDVAHLEERALMLLLADQRTWEPFVVGRALDGDEALRRFAATQLARTGQVEAGPPIERLLADPAVSVRRAAVFGLGELGEQGFTGAAGSLLGALADPDRETGRLAVEASAKLGVDLETVVERLIAAPSAELLPRLVPSLYRFDSPAVVRWAEQGLEASDPQLRAMAAYGLAREPRPEGVPLLRALLADGDPWVRGWAARALGRLGDRSDLERLRPLLEDPEAGPIIQALRAARRLIDDARAAPPESWRERLLELMEDPRPGVRLTAIEASAAWLLDEALGEALGRLALAGERRQRELALLALADGEDPRAASLLVRFAGDADPVLRRRAAEAAALYRAAGILEQLAADDDPGVRRAVLEVHLAADDETAAELARSALEDADSSLRAAALGWAAENPVLEMEVLLPAMAVAWRDRSPETRLAGVGALEKRAEAEPLERGAIVAELEELTSDREYLVRRRAARALSALDREAPAVGPVEGTGSLALYREIVQQTVRPRRLDILTERGTIGVELACPEAPRTCLSFLQLAGQGFYDGLAFHRVVPDFVVQAGDPRGDGQGGPGYTIRDEINALRYRRGTLGMALSGPDTGGSQFFITLAPQPHLDGGYTVFGRVISGEPVLDRIVQGDRILGIVEAGGS